jgi:hypothetical protein
MVEINVLGGAESIGGNFVKIEDVDRIPIFDQGIRFDVMASYYKPFITLRSTMRKFICDAARGYIYPHTAARMYMRDYIEPQMRGPHSDVPDLRYIASRSSRRGL